MYEPSNMNFVMVLRSVERFLAIYGQLKVLFVYLLNWVFL